MTNSSNTKQQRTQNGEAIEKKRKTTTAERTHSKCIHFKVPILCSLCACAHICVCLFFFIRQFFPLLPFTAVGILCGVFSTFLFFRARICIRFSEHKWREREKDDIMYIHKKICVQVDSLHLNRFYWSAVVEYRYCIVLCIVHT